MLLRPFRHLRAGLAIGGLALAGCSREEPPERAALGPAISEPLCASGRIALQGGLGDARQGAVSLRLIEADSGRVLLWRIYDLGDPAWDRRGTSQGLYFSLSAEDAFEARPPVHAPLTLEATYLPSGRSVSEEPGEQRSTLALAGPARELRLELRGALAVAGIEPGARTSPR